MIIRVFIIFLTIFSSLSTIFAEDRIVDLDGTEWPRDFELKKYTITMYQPQLEQLNGNVLECRAAFSMKKKNGEPVFGAMWMETLIDTDTDDRLVFFDNVVISTIKFPNEDPDDVEKGRKELNERLEGLRLTMSMDRFSASLSDLEYQHEVNEELDNTAPDVFFVTEPAVLVLIDGEPILKKDENSGLQYVVNTAFFIVYDDKSRLYYLKGGEWWYSAKNPKGDYVWTEKVPSNVEKFSEQAFKGEETDVDSLSLNLDEAPDVILSTTPAELLISDGEPQMEPVSGTDLLYVKNSESDIIMDIDDQKYYILIAGRWYSSSSMNSNSWTFINPEALPDDFYRIPADSEISDVRPSISGTQESKDAILDNSIPQTATIDRKNSNS